MAVLNTRQTVHQTLATILYLYTTKEILYWRLNHQKDGHLVRFIGRDRQKNIFKVTSALNVMSNFDQKVSEYDLVLRL